VRGFDATFSAPKSVSVLFGVDEQELRHEITDAHGRAVDAVLGWIEAHAHTRLRRRGHIVCVDAEGIIDGVFRQRTSRRLDPQLHAHAVIANRVKAPDGRCWRWMHAPSNWTNGPCRRCITPAAKTVFGRQRAATNSR
jgi:conjugative relaxase-like TrwC/TraI family protein